MNTQINSHFNSSRKKRLRVLLKKSINNTLLCRPFTHAYMDTKLSLFWRSTDIRGADTDVKHRLFTMNQNKGKMWS